MPRAIIIHGFAGSPHHAWLPWLQTQLTEHDWQVVSPSLPHPQQPDLVDWLYAVMDAVGTPDLNTVLVGHSLGGTTVLHYLQHLTANYQVAGAVLVGAPTVGTQREILQPFFATPFNWEKIKNSCRQIVGIYADEDPMVDLAQGQLLADKADAKLIVLHTRTHFYTDITELPPALDAVLRIPLG